MTAPLSIRPMDALDMASVLTIQALCYDESKQESAESFLSKLVPAVPASFVAELGGRVVGYMVAVPVDACGPLPLHDTGCRPAGEATALYLHDLAVHPDARRFGVAAALVNAYRRALAGAGLRRGCLTAVGGSMAFWARHGFREAVPQGPAAALLAAYGAGARFMTLELPASAALSPAGA